MRGGRGEKQNSKILPVSAGHRGGTLLIFAGSEAAQRDQSAHRKLLAFSDPLYFDLDRQRSLGTEVFSAEHCQWLRAYPAGAQVQRSGCAIALHRDVYLREVPLLALHRFGYHPGRRNDRALYLYRDVLWPQVSQRE